MIKDIFYRMSSWAQLFFLLLFCFGGLMFGVAFTMLISPLMGGMQSLDFIRVAQVVQSCTIFLLPALLCAALFHEKAADYLKINKAINLKFLLYSTVLIIVIQPVISMIGHYNRLMTLPESLSGLEMLIRNVEDSRAALLDQILADRSVVMILVNLFIIAVVAGITEEFFFRGSMQQLLRKVSNNRHVAVWITAFIFSFIHLQFYGFFPRMLLGAVLGYLFVWSGNLWVPVIIHTLNNAMSVSLYLTYKGTPTYERLESLGTGSTLWVVIVAILISGVLMYLLSKEYIQNTTDEEFLSDFE